MILALGFATPLLLLGLLAVAIPLLLHLLARSRAQEMLFPTLRFLRISMEKTARRRRIQHVLLMALRMLLLGLLALAVAEPISQAIGGWLGGRGYACVLLVDNSMSMSAAAGARSAAEGGQTAFRSRLEKARDEASALLNADERPSVAALWTTNGPAADEEAGLTARLDSLRERVDRIAPSYDKAPLAQRVGAALAELRKQSAPQKAIALFSDLQRISFEELLAAGDLARAEDVHLLVINTASRSADNLAVTGVKVEGRPIVDQLQTAVATVENCDPESNHVVNVGVRVAGQPVGQKVRLELAAAGAEGSKAVARVNWFPREAGVFTGEVALDEADDLPQDNRRHFALKIGGRVKTVIVRGPAGQDRQGASDPAWMLTLALDPFRDKSAPWFIESQTVESADFTAASIEGAEAVFLTDVPKFSVEQVSALETLTARGGTVGIFLGPSVDAKNYNETLGRAGGPEGGLLPAPLEKPVGELGPTAAALFLNWVDLEHPYFKGLYKDLSDVKADIRGFVRRYYQVGAAPATTRELARLENGRPLLLAKPFGAGRVVLCTTSASPGWSNLPATTLFPPMLIRMSLQARRTAAEETSFAPGAAATIRLASAGEANAAVVTVTTPSGADGKVQTATAQAVRTSEGLVARFTRTSAAGAYHWKATPAGGAAGEQQEETGCFVVNPLADESRLAAMSPEELQRGLAAKGFAHVYVGSSFASAREAAIAAAQKRNWWDVLAAAAIVALVVESLIANRSRKSIESAVPAHLNPKIASQAG